MGAVTEYLRPRAFSERRRQGINRAAAERLRSEWGEKLGLDSVRWAEGELEVMLRCGERFSIPWSGCPTRDPEEGSRAMAKAIGPFVHVYLGSVEALVQTMRQALDQIREDGGRLAMAVEGRLHYLPLSDVQVTYSPDFDVSSSSDPVANGRGRLQVTIRPDQRTALTLDVPFERRVSGPVIPFLDDVRRQMEQRLCPVLLLPSLPESPIDHPLAVQLYRRAHSSGTQWDFRSEGREPYRLQRTDCAAVCRGQPSAFVDQLRALNEILATPVLLDTEALLWLFTALASEFDEGPLEQATTRQRALFNDVLENDPNPLAILLPLTSGLEARLGSDYALPAIAMRAGDNRLVRTVASSGGDVHRAHPRELDAFRGPSGAADQFTVDLSEDRRTLVIDCWTDPTHPAIDPAGRLSLRFQSEKGDGPVTIAKVGWMQMPLDFLLPSRSARRWVSTAADSAKPYKTLVIQSADPSERPFYLVTEPRGPLLVVGRDATYLGASHGRTLSVA